MERGGLYVAYELADHRQGQQQALRFSSSIAAVVGALALVGILSQSQQATPSVPAVSATVTDADTSQQWGRWMTQPTQKPAHKAYGSHTRGSAPVASTAAASSVAAGTDEASTDAAVNTAAPIINAVAAAAGPDGERPVFDSTGRFIMRAFDEFKPMSSFLPGVGGVWGVPMWTFYVNRGQAIATFGVTNKAGGILLFQTADKAYQATPYLGFRTLLKGKRASGATFEAQPFLPSSDAAKALPARRDMFIGNNELEIEESDPATGIKTNVLYFNAPNEDFPALVRRVTFTNEGDEAIELDVVDGLAKLEPEGGLDKLGPDKQIITIGRTLEGWMHVYHFDKHDRTAPFFHFVTAPADTADVSPIKEGHFAVAFLEDDTNVDADHKHALLPMICDQQVVFGTDTTLTVPRKFFSNAAKPDGASLEEVLKAPQSTTSRTPSAFAAASIALTPGESKTLTILYGHAPDLETFTSSIVPKVKAKGYVSGKRQEASALGTILTERVSMSSAVPQLDAYAKQNYLDNLLRGGMPIQIGGVDNGNTKIFHAFSRIHGDLERDYNNFVIEGSYWSQGPGNFRDVNQNRRCDVLQLPAVHDFNVRQFLSFVQADGYSQLTVATALFKIRDPSKVAAVAQAIASSDTIDAAKRVLGAPFRPGQLFTDLRNFGVEIAMEKEPLLELATKDAEQVTAGQYPTIQNGFWTDHFTYHLDLVTNFLSVYPDEKEAMLYDSEPIPFFLSPGRCVNRTEKNMLLAEGKVRQFDAVLNATSKVSELSKIYSDPKYVGGGDGGGDWQLTTSGATMKVTILAKLLTLGANKFAIMDPLGMGLEMEAGKPGWNDAMNGLPALFGSEMPSAYELLMILKFVGKAVDEIGRPVEMPEEVSKLLDAFGVQLAALKAGGKDFDYWDKVHDALEEYRTSTDATFTGEFVSWSAAKLGTASGLLGKMIARMEQGATRALAWSQKGGRVVETGGVVPTYFKFTVTDYELTGLKSNRGLPTVKVGGFEPSVLPLFLEGPTRQLKTLSDPAEKLAVYEAVAASDIVDHELKMYKISASLADMPIETGRMKAFDSGWLENESIWLHMSYKYYLELLRAGLYAQFYEEIQTGVVSFMDPEVLGRSPLEAASFIVSSAFPDKTLHGSGFLARLSGSTAEFLSMWNHMMFGAAPFVLDADEKLRLALTPVISSWLWKADGTLTFTFLGAIEVTYKCASKKNTWDAAVTSYVLKAADGSETTIDGPTVPEAVAKKVRSLYFTAITVTIE